MSFETNEARGVIPKWFRQAERFQDGLRFSRRIAQTTCQVVFRQVAQRGPICCFTEWTDR